jgi:hypothetical protein
MNSVISLLAISLFIVIVYSWSSMFYDKHKYNKKLYMKSKYSSKKSPNTLKKK